MVGESSPRYAYSWIPISTHAEIDALQKLKGDYLREDRKNRRPLRMNLMVVRLSKTGILNNAEPCYHCLQQLKVATFVNIKNVYYSTAPDQIVCKKFDDMVNSPTNFISSGYLHRMGLSLRERKTTPPAETPYNPNSQKMQWPKSQSPTKSHSPTKSPTKTLSPTKQTPCKMARI